jgi:vacuolar-type H+-ATPase subunit I/STV1
MSWIRREWTSEAADRWSREDWIAALFSAMAYLLILLGSALSLLAMPVGFMLLGGGILAAAAMYFVIDPKLRAISADYEKKQKAYLERLERLTRWSWRE